MVPPRCAAQAVTGACGDAVGTLTWVFAVHASVGGVMRGLKRLAQANRRARAVWRAWAARVEATAVSVWENAGCCRVAAASHAIRGDHGRKALQGQQHPHRHAERRNERPSPSALCTRDADACGAYQRGGSSLGAAQRLRSQGRSLMHSRRGPGPSLWPDMAARSCFGGCAARSGRGGRCSCGMSLCVLRREGTGCRTGLRVLRRASSTTSIGSISAGRACCHRGRVSLSEQRRPGAVAT